VVAIEKLTLEQFSLLSSDSFTGSFSDSFTEGLTGLCA
jgi:hypothetical protein